MKDLFKCCVISSILISLCFYAGNFNLFINSMLEQLTIVYVHQACCLILFM
jgi:hypothetical protein